MTDFSLALFSTNAETVRDAVSAGVEMVVVDWENRGKAARQSGVDTEINADTADDLRRVRAATTATIVCRINQFGAWTYGEVESALECGADEILLPMVRGAAEVESLLRIVNDRCKAGILVETTDAVARAHDLSTLPLSRVYFGLHDFAIERRSTNIFMPVVDGTLERTRDHFDVPFGFGGLTLPDRGSPIPCTLLLGAMLRLDCRFSFLRRSFHRDVALTTIALAVAQIRHGIDDAAARSPESVDGDWRALESFVLDQPALMTTARDGERQEA